MPEAAALPTPRALLQVLCELGMVASDSIVTRSPSESLTVELNGKVIGTINNKYATAVVAQLRAVKAAKLSQEEHLTPGMCCRQLSASLDRAVRWSMGGPHKGTGGI